MAPGEDEFDTPGLDQASYFLIFFSPIFQLFGFFFPFFASIGDICTQCYLLSTKLCISAIFLFPRAFKK